jgi:hypothetical protein
MNDRSRSSQSMNAAPPPRLFAETQRNERIAYSIGQCRHSRRLQQSRDVHETLRSDLVFVGSICGRDRPCRRPNLLRLRHFRVRHLRLRHDWCVVEHPMLGFRYQPGPQHLECVWHGGHGKRHERWFDRHHRVNGLIRQCRSRYWQHRIVFRRRCLERQWFWRQRICPALGNAKLLNA